MAAQDSGRLVVDEARLEAIAKEQADVWTDILALQQDITALSNAVADRQMEQLSSKLNENLKLNDLPYDDEGDDDSIPNHEDSSDSMDKLAMRLSLFKFRDRTTQSYHERSIIEFAHRVRFNRLIQHAGRRGYKICWTTALRNRTTPINSTADEEEEPDTEQQEDKKEQPDEKAPADQAALDADIFKQMKEHAATLMNEAATMEQHIAAAQAVRRMLSRENNPPNQEAIDAGLIPALIRYLPSQNDTLAFETCWALTNIASGTSEQTRAVVDAGAIPLFVELLASPSVNVFEQAIWALGNIAGDSAELRDIVLAAGVMRMIISSLTGRENIGLSAWRNATWLISNLARGKPRPDFHIVSPSIPLLSQLLGHDDLEVRCDAAWALSSLSDGPNDRIAAVCEAGVIPRLIQLLSLNAPRVLTPALRCLGNIVTGDDTMTQVVVDAGFVPHLVKLVDHPKRSIQKEACWSLSNITAGTVNQIEVVVRSGALPLLVRQAIDGLFEVAKEACWALANLCEGGTAAQIQVALEANMLLAFDRMLQGQDTRIIVVAMQGIMASARKLDGAFYGFLDASLTLSLLEALQEHENPEVYRAAIAALELLDQNQGSDQED